jgi:hypothetical protein
MPSFETGSVTPAAPTNVGVGAASTSVVAFNADRKGLVLVNISANKIYLAFDNTASLYKGIALTPNGGAWSMDDYTFCVTAINAIAEGADSTLCIQEFNT